MHVRFDVVDLEDERISPFRNVRDRDLARAHGGSFLVEGEVGLRLLIERGLRPVRAVLLAEGPAARLAPLLERLPAGTPVYVAPTALVEAIVGFPMHRGVLALAERGRERTVAELLEPRPRVVLGLCGLTNHDNVGGVFRNAAAFGAGAVLLDAATCDPLYRKAVRVSVGGSMLVPFARVTDEDALVDQVVDHGYAILALSPRGERVVGRDAPPAVPTALLIGSEGPGLSPRTLARVPTARIPMAGDWDSLNVAVASGVALSWLHRGQDT
jgi:tRNA G18 (ribose-2'-O)-methylase SpoU